ncbi:MAG: hypothetical protein RIS64_2550, partial [Bacteroidota bacterium]
KPLKQPDNIMESYNLPTTVASTLSSVHIPVRWSQSDIEQMLNNQITGVLYEDTSLDSDGLKMKATKSRSIKIRLEGMSMTYRVPVHLWIFKKLLETKVTGVRGIEAEGEIALTFKTVLQLNSDWSLQSKTELTGYEWLKNMAVKTGLGNLDVKYIANLIVDRTQTELTKGIDTSIKQSVDLPSRMNDVWKMLQNPIKLDETYPFWLKLTPQTISVTALSAVGDELTAMVATSGVTEAVMSETQPSFDGNINLPNFELSKDILTKDDFEINLTTKIPMHEAEAMAQKMVIGESIQLGGQTVKITSLKLFGQNNQLIVNAGFSGNYSGNISLIGTPVFDPTTNTLKLENVNYELNDINFLLRSALWLFEGVIAKKIKEKTIFPIGSKLSEIKVTVNEKLQNYVLNNFTTINGLVEHLNINQLDVMPEGIKIYANATGKIGVQISGLGGY